MHAQKLKTKPDPTTLKKNQVYKNQKMFDSKTGATNSKTPIERQADNAVERSKYEVERLKDPTTGKIPSGIRELELKFSEKISLGSASQKSLATSAKSSTQTDFYNWKNRGPFNVGGRTRALAIDRTNENVILAGGVSGGLWRSENSGASWTKVTRNFQAPSITAIIQDPRPFKSNIWYYTSGERLGNSATTSSFYTGTGVYKSQDGGKTFELLRATADATVDAISPFDITNSIAINPINGDIYVATFNGLHRSNNDGNSFTEVLAGGFDNRVEVKITPSGKIYATIEFDGVPNAGYFTSTDGDNWTNITPPDFITNYGRTVMEYVPSDENIIYFFTHNIDGDAVLQKYDATDNTWVDLSTNLPNSSIGGSVGDLNLQGGYNMVIKIHPTNSDIVFVGGTNIYRSTTGFTTPAGQESWIAGYSPINNVSLYTNQHPDQHELVFFPSNPNKVLSGNDGGVFLTEDITVVSGDTEQVTWTSLNNGYITTQPYHVSFDTEANSDDLLAGFQDNGTWFTNSTATNATWVEDFGGDGSYSAIADGGLTRYVSSQNGNAFRFNFDESGEFVSFTSVQPVATGFSFINPFILDPNNDNIMYMPIGTSIWRNSDLDEIPLFSNADTSVNWEQLAQAPSNSTITALDVSRYPVANKLYIGTTDGFIYKMDNANIDNQELIDISSGKGLPTGFINDITVDPSDENRVIATFSNYGIPSVFFTEDGGETWVDVSGNLEQNVDGTGSGPSVRATAFLGSEGDSGARQQRVFAATSTGLYYTNYFSGQNTVWQKENNTIGHAVVDYVETRKDGFVAAAAHGNGLFSARFPITQNPLPDATLTVAYDLPNITVAENSDGEDIVIDFTGLFVQSEGLPITIELDNSNPDFATVTLVDDQLTISYTPNTLDETTISLIATSNGEQVSEGFVLVTEELPFYEQTEPIISSLPSQNFIDFGGLIAQSADDFTVPDGNSWVIERIIAFGGANGSPSFSSATVVIYENNNGTPGEEIYNADSLTPISDPLIANLEIPLPETLTLESGNYWISIYVNLEFGIDGNQWFWSSQENNVGEISQFRDVANLFGAGATDWTPGTIFTGTPIDQTFQIYGDIINSSSNGDDGLTEASLTTLETELNSLAWPNPSTGIFYFNLNSLQDENVSMNIFDVSGKLVHKSDNLKTNINQSWDASASASGIYFISLEGKNTSKRFKIIKK